MTDSHSVPVSLYNSYASIFCLKKKQRFNGQIRPVLKLVFVYLKVASKQIIHHNKYVLKSTVAMNSVLEATSLLMLIFCTFS